MWFVVWLVVAWVVWTMARRWLAAKKVGGQVANGGGREGFEVAVVGESHYQPALTRLCGGKTRDSANCAFVADVVPEDANPYDSNAMRVDINGQTVGYLSRDAAVAWRSRHGGQGVQCNAVVRGGWKRGRGDEGSFGVWLRLPG